MDTSISFEFAVYYLSEPRHDPLAQLENLLKDKFKTLRKLESIENGPAEPSLSARIETEPRKYAPPDADALKYFGRGLSSEQARALQNPMKILILDFGYAAERGWEAMRSALELTQALAQSQGGLIWDDATREVFSPEAWQERRITAWTEKLPDISQHTVIHAYKSNEYVRAITLGMEKFGLPDLVINDFPWSMQRNMGHIINMFAQAIIEGSTLTKPGEFDLDFKKIKNSKVRQSQLTTLKPNATGVALLSLRKGEREEGDAMNRLIEISFDRGSGPDVHARQEKILSQAFGWEDSVKSITHDEELRAASRQARTKLPTLRAAFLKGLAPGELIQVKAPFPTSDGATEWMWVEVIAWNQDKISGLLRDEPSRIPNLHAGQTVEVLESKVFDYIRTFANGTIEGNETAKIIERLAR
jgi:uncharacterized protein YegJ (DUF2314 family)